MSSKKQQEISKEEKDWSRVDDVVFESGSFLFKYQKQILIAVVVLIAIVGGVWAYNTLYLNPKNNDAQVALFKGEQYFQNRMDSLALYGDGSGYVGFEAIINDFGSTKAGNIARYYAGVSYSRMGKYNEAINHLKGFSGGDQMITNAAKGVLGDCYVNSGKLEDAAKCFVDAAKGADNQLLTPVFYKKAAMVYRSMNNNDKVIELFTLIKNDYANSAEAAEADKFIMEAEVLKGTK